MRAHLSFLRRTPLLSKISGATILLLLSVNHSNAEFLDDLFGDDDTHSRGQINLEAGQGQTDYRSKDKISKPVNALQHRKENRKVFIQQSDEDHTSEKKTNGSNLALCLDQSSKTEASQKADAYLYDKDLKNGDSIMTPNGILVFKGHSSCPHRPDEFIALSSANAPKSNKKALVTLDAAAKSQWNSH